MIKKRKILVGLGIVLFCLGLTSIIPLVYYYFRIPTNDQISVGANLSGLFNDFKTPLVSSISDVEIIDKIVCMSCLPDKIGSKSCKSNMASFIAKKLLEPQSIFSWHLRNAYLTKAIYIKYDSRAVTRTYFAFVAEIFREVTIDSLCTKEFSKVCNQLGKEDLIEFQRGISSGRFPPKYGPSEESLQSCLSAGENAENFKDAK